MQKSMIRRIKKQVDSASVVSFGIFDTMLFRKTNTQLEMFDLVGKHFDIHGFRRIRIEGQRQADEHAGKLGRYSYADIDEIYAVISETESDSVDWNAVKRFEIEMEENGFIANAEVMEIYRYAREKKKRVVAVSRLRLSPETINRLLKKHDYLELDNIYCISDRYIEKSIFEEMAEREQVAYENIFHLGDDPLMDAEMPKSYGIQTILYDKECDVKKIQDTADSEIDKGLYKNLYSTEIGFWYNLGVEVGGPLYMGLFLWLKKRVGKTESPIYFIAPDGYILCQLFKRYGYSNVECIYASRFSLALAGTTQINEEAIELLPPYEKGKTVGEVLDELCVERDKIKYLSKAGFETFDDVIRSDKDILSFKKLYIYDKNAFMDRCALERKHLEAALSKLGFFTTDSTVFTSGIDGDVQYLLERLKKATNCKYSSRFYNLGVCNTKKNRERLKGIHYESYLCDFYKNYSLQTCMKEAPALYELFFLEPYGSVSCVDKNKTDSKNGENKRREQLIKGIMDYIHVGIDFAERYDVEYGPEAAIAHLQRLILRPTEEEARIIGDICYEDPWIRRENNTKRIAYLRKEQFTEEQDNKIYWYQGFFKRQDIDEELKKNVALRLGRIYPEPKPELYHLEDEQSILDYHNWIDYEESHKRDEEPLSYLPMFSVVIPIYNTVTEQLEECFNSVLNQSYSNYELILVDDHSSWANVVPVLKEYEKYEKIHVIYRTSNGHISEATNDGIAIAEGEFIAFMDCDDVLAPSALYEMAKKLNENPELDFIYSDEDKITEDGKIRHMPFFKPDWSPDLFMCMMYTNHLGVYRSTIVKEIGGLRSAYNGSQDYDFTLRFMEKSSNDRVGHVSNILYHWRERKESAAFSATSKNYAADAARYAKEDYIRRKGIEASVEYITGMPQYRIVYNVTENPLVSIIIPSKDHYDILKQCIDSIFEYTNYKNFEIIVVDNGSSENNRQRIETYLHMCDGEYVYDPCEFNFSRMCNVGAAHALGDYLLFLNDDIELFQPEWLGRMLGHAQRPHVGAVGAKLFYPNSTIIQHAGVVNAIEGPTHFFTGQDDEPPFYFGWNRVDINCIAVTGACLLVATEKFEQIGGFDETFPVAYNDIDLCFKLHKKGYYNVLRNDVVAYHHESLSRGNDFENYGKMFRLIRDRTRLYTKHPEFKRYDPFLNSHLHNLGWSLHLLTNCADVQRVELIHVISDGIMNLDAANLGSNKVEIQGWSVIEHMDDEQIKKRQLVFVDPFGAAYCADVIPELRQDVSNCYGGGEKHRHAGFRCILDKAKFRMDVMPYRIGMLTFDHEGTKVLTWWNLKLNPSHPPMCRPEVCESERLEEFNACLQNDRICWAMDEISVHDECFFVRGYAFLNADTHMWYKKSIVLVSDEEAFEFDVQDEERLDVTHAFPRMHFLYYTGFRCYMLKDTFEKGKAYRMFIRLRNQFDSGDVLDVETGEGVSW